PIHSAFTAATTLSNSLRSPTSPATACSPFSAAPFPLADPKSVLRWRRSFRHLERHAFAAFPPCNPLYETTGFRSTPIFSISHSTASPGFKYSDFGSSLHAATPDTVPVESTSPAEYPIGE